MSLPEFSFLNVDTSWAPVGGNRDAYFLRREITWGLAQRKRTCSSSWTSSDLKGLDLQSGSKLPTWNVDYKWWGITTLPIIKKKEAVLGFAPPFYKRRFFLQSWLVLSNHKIIWGTTFDSHWLCRSLAGCLQCVYLCKCSWMSACGSAVYYYYSMCALVCSVFVL